MIEKFDIIIIGSGGGSKITRPAANLGYSVAIIDEGPLGGTCLNRGCIPSKMLIHPADVIAEIQTAAEFDIHVPEGVSVDVERLVKRVSNEVSKESESIKPLYDAHENITLFSDTARFISNTEIEVSGRRITADSIFIAAGGRPLIPDIPGIHSCPYWTSTEALRSTQIPSSLIILGGGYIATELGYYFQKMGSHVTFLVRNKMIKYEDHDIIEQFESQFARDHHILFKTYPTSISYDNDRFSVSLNTGEVIESEAFLVAAGIQPNSDRLRLDRTDIDCTDQGFIRVNESLQTKVPHVYAFGDIIGRYQFRHSANVEGQHLFDSVVKRQQPEPLIYPPIPHAIFTNPQVAGVGLTEQECKEKQLPYTCGINAYKDSAMGMALLSDGDFVKLIFSTESTELIGAHIIGREAATMIHMLILALSMKATYKDLSSMVYIHPALPEVVRNAVRNVDTNQFTK